MFTSNGDWGKEHPLERYSEKVYCIRGADIQHVIMGDKGKIPIRFLMESRAKMKCLTDGDIVIEISGGSPTQSTGRSALISSQFIERHDAKMICTNFCRVIKPKEQYSRFIYCYLQFLYENSTFFSYENGTTGIKNLDITRFINTEKIYLPPISLIERFDKICRDIFSKINQDGKEIEYLSKFRDALLPRLMSGELDVSNIEL